MGIEALDMMSSKELFIVRVFPYPENYCAIKFQVLEMNFF